MSKPSQRPRRSPGRPADSAHSDRRKDLLQAALHCFGARGYDGTSLSQVASQAGTDVGLIRYYFGSKEALWMAAIDSMAHRLGDELAPLLAQKHGAAAERLAGVIRWFIDMSAQHPYLSRIIVLDGSSDGPRGTYVAQQLVGPFYRAFAKLIAAAKREGRVPDVAPRTIFFMVTHGGSFPMAMPALTNAFPGGAISSPRALKAHADAIVALIMRERS